MPNLPPLIQDIRASVEFGGYVRQLSVRVPEDDQRTDVRLQIGASPCREGASVSDLHVYWDRADLTPFIVEDLAAALRELPATSLEMAYRAGVSSWWTLARRMGDFDSEGEHSAVGQALARDAPA